MGKVTDTYNNMSALAKAAGAIVTVIVVIGGATIAFTSKVSIAEEALDRVIAVEQNIHTNYAPLIVAKNLQEQITANTASARLLTLEASLSSKEKRLERIKDKQPNVKDFPDNSTTKEEYDKLVKGIKKLEDKITILIEKMGK